MPITVIRLIFLFVLISALSDQAQSEEAAPMPVITDYTSLRVVLHRDYACYVECPMYAVEIFGDGRVVYEGMDNVAIYGVHRDRISPERVRALIAAFQEADYFVAPEEYLSDYTRFVPIDSGGKITLRILFDDFEKSVRYEPGYSAVPDAIVSLSGLVDDAAGTVKWVQASPDTFRSLQDEGWDFSVATEDNRKTMIAAIQRGPEEPIFSLLDSGMPLDGRLATYGLIPTTAFEAAIELGNERVLAELVRVVVRRGGHTLNDSLWQIAAEDRPDIAGTLVRGGADLNYIDDYGVTPLMRSAEALHPNMVALFLESGADVAQKDVDGSNALHWVLSGWSDEGDARALEVISILVNAGLDVNATDASGQAPLARTNWYGEKIHAVRQALINAGAR